MKEAILGFAVTVSNNHIGAENKQPLFSTPCNICKLILYFFAGSHEERKKKNNNKLRGLKNPKTNQCCSAQDE